MSHKTNEQSKSSETLKTDQETSKDNSNKGAGNEGGGNSKILLALAALLGAGGIVSIP